MTDSGHPTFSLANKPSRIMTIHSRRTVKLGSVCTRIADIAFIWIWCGEYPYHCFYSFFNQNPSDTTTFSRINKRFSAYFYKERYTDTLTNVTLHSRLSLSYNLLYVCLFLFWLTWISYFVQSVKKMALFLPT